MDQKIHRQEEIVWEIIACEDFSQCSRDSFLTNYNAHTL